MSLFGSVIRDMKRDPLLRPHVRAMNSMMRSFFGDGFRDMDNGLGLMRSNVRETMMPSGGALPSFEVFPSMMNQQMNQKDRRKLQENYANLVEVMYSNISPYLISKFILDPDMHAEIQTGRTDKQKMEKLLAILPSRGSQAMEEFIKALKPNYGWLARRLENDDCVNTVIDTVKYDCNASNSETDYDESNLKEMPIHLHLKKIEKVFQNSLPICKNWTNLASSMCLKPSVIMDIKRDMIQDGGLDYAIRAVLENWVTKLGYTKATFRKLITIVEDLEWNDVAESLIELWASLLANGEAFEA